MMCAACSDAQGAAFQQSVWYAFMTNGGHLPPPWTTINSAQNWPTDYAINLIQKPLSSSSSSLQVAVNFKNNICNYFTTLNINQMSYWWCN